MEILLTGASGFIGKSVLPLLLANGHTVYSLGRRVTQNPAANLIELPGNLMEDHWPEEVPWDRIDAVAHLAAAGVKAARRNWRESFEVNVGGTMKLLSAIKRHAVKNPRLLVTRTFYEHVINEDASLRNDAYIATKAVSTDLVRAWSKDYSGPVSFATLFQIYGPGDDRGNVLSYAAHQFAISQVARFGSGQGVRDWIYLDDAAQALVLMIQADTVGTTEWDVGSGKLTSLRRMLEELATVAGVGGELLDFDPSRDRGDLSLKLAANRFLPNWARLVSLPEGLKRVWSAAKWEGQH